MRLAVSILLVSILLAGCTTEAPEWHSFPAQATPALDAKRLQAESSRDALMKGLLTELQAAMKQGGPVAGIAVCNEKAPQVLAKLNTDGLRLGRTSHKLRNPSNQPPAWAQPFVDAKTSKPILLVNRASHLRALYPIALKSQCIACHGKPEEIPAPVQKAIAQRYPTDQATGFAVDDLRGWLWVEVD